MDGVGNPHDNFFLNIGIYAESDHGDVPVDTHDAREENLEVKTRDVGYGHKVKESEIESKMIHGVPFIDDQGNYIPLSQEQKVTILNKDMQTESNLARQNAWDKKLNERGSSWDELDIRYRYCLTSLAYNVGGSKAAQQWDSVLTAAVDRKPKEFAKQLRRKDNNKHTAGMDNRVLKELYYSMIIRNASEVLDVLPLADPDQAGVPR
tara:strand:- start:379 stop:999 length:621 start_codon:yes stop_codon:yes gene_type:complete